MERARITGPGAGVWKYDILTALTLWGLQGGPVEQMSALRLIALITARYNWQRDEVSIGQRDLARLWGVTERTVKRELKRLSTLQLLDVLRPGVRGRVASYRLVPETVIKLSVAHWESVGPDFAERWSERQMVPVKQEGPRVLRVDFQRLRGTEGGGGELPSDPWGRMQARLRMAAPDAFDAWFAGLRLSAADEAGVEIACQSAFVQRYIETHFGELLREAVVDGFGRHVQLTLSVQR